MRTLLAALLAALAAVGLARSAGATQVEHLDTRQLTRLSSDVVIGRIERVHARWNEKRTKIFTDVDVSVSRSLKGGGSRITLTQLGGTVGDLRYEVAGCPAFRPGEEALLFVWRDPQGGAQLTGLGQGKFEIRRDGAGRAFVQRSVEGLSVRDVRGLSLAPAGRPSPATLPLEDLVREIQGALAEDGR